MYIIEELYGDETHLPTEKEKTNPDPRIYETNENRRRQKCLETETPIREEKPHYLKA